MRTLKRGRSKSIVVPGVKDRVKNQGRISRLNNYTPRLKRHKGSISLSSDLDSIEEESEHKPSGGNQSRESKVEASLGSTEKKDISEIKRSNPQGNQGGGNGSFANYRFGVIVNNVNNSSMQSNEFPQPNGSINQTEESKI